MSCPIDIVKTGSIRIEWKSSDFPDSVPDITPKQRELAAKIDAAMIKALFPAVR